MKRLYWLVFTSIFRNVLCEDVVAQVESKKYVYLPDSTRRGNEEPRPPTPKTPTVRSEAKYPWTALDEYVWKDDGMYSWHMVDGYPIFVNDVDGDYWYYTINVTTQRWQNSSLFNQDIDCTRQGGGHSWNGPCDCSLWFHYVGISVPVSYLDSLASGERNLLDDSAFLLIGSGNNYDLPLRPEEEQPFYVAKIALATNSIGVSVRAVPFHPCIFADDPLNRTRVEDEVIAWTWRKFLDNPSWTDIPLRNPMTKSIVKVMDAVQEMMWQEHSANIGRFCVTGASKRGWTTWTVAGVDYERVKCAMPVMMDTVNLVKTLHNSYRSLGNWTYMFLDYYVENILKDLDTDAFRELEAMIDPYSYRKRYADTLVYYNGMANDGFFMPDDSWFYLSSLANKPVPNFYQQVENCGHDWKCSQNKLWEAGIGFYYAYMAGQNLPSVYSKRSGGKVSGKVEVRSDKPIVEATLWFARSVPGRRDFRDYGYDAECFRAKLHNPDDPCNPEIDQLSNVTFYQSSPLPVKYNENEGYYYSSYIFNKPMNETELYFYAYFIEAVLPGPMEAGTKTEVYSNTFRFTSEVGITPEELPFEDCGIQQNTNCQQHMT